MQDIAQRRAGGRCHDADRPWPRGKRTLAFGGEQTLLFQSRLQPQEFLVAFTLPRRAQAFCIKLVLTRSLVHPDATEDLHAIPVFRNVGERQDLRLPHHTAQRGLVVLECEIQVPGRGARDIRYLASDPEFLEPVVAFQPLANIACKLSYGPDGAVEQACPRFHAAKDKPCPEGCQPKGIMPASEQANASSWPGRHHWRRQR